MFPRETSCAFSAVVDCTSARGAFDPVFFDSYVKAFYFSLWFLAVFVSGLFLYAVSCTTPKPPLAVRALCRPDAFVVPPPSPQVIDYERWSGPMCGKYIARASHVRHQQLPSLVACFFTSSEAICAGKSNLEDRDECMKNFQKCKNILWVSNTRDQTQISRHQRHAA